MATYDLGDPVGLSVNIRDALGALANAGAVTLTVTLPDGTTTAPTVTNTATGVYTATYTPTVAGLFGAMWVATGANASAYRDSFTVLATEVPLLSLDDVKARLNITTTDNDEELRRVIAAATGRASRAVKRALSVRTLTQTTDMTYTPARAVTVDEPALLNVDEVTEDGVVVDPNDYELARDGQVVRRKGTDRWTGEVSITGTIGVAGEDLAIAQQAVLELTAHLWETQRTPAGRNALAGPVPGMGYALPNRVDEMLAPLRLDGFA